MKKNVPCIELENVHFKYAGAPSAALEHITFSVERGEYLGVIGPNGGGKTTVLKLILGLLKPTSGAIRLFGTPVESFKDHSRIGYVPQRVSQEIVQFPATVEEIVESGRTAKIGLLRRFDASDRGSVAKAMEIADVGHHRNRMLHHLSGGERQRVFIARALAGEPDLLILDEPAVGVDVVSQEKFYRFIERLNKEFGLTIIFVSHDIDVVAHEVGTVVCLNHTLVAHGPPQEYIQQKYLEKLYGKKIRFILHDH